MPDVLTTIFGFVKQTVGGNRNTWGGILNNNFDAVEAALAGDTSLVVTGGSTVLTDAQVRKRFLMFTGTLSSEQTIEVPNRFCKWIVRNGTTGAFALKFKTSAGTAVEVPQGGSCEVFCDGDDTIYVGVSTANLSSQFRGPNGTLAAPGWSFDADRDTGFYRKGADNLAGVVGGAEFVDVTSNKNAAFKGDVSAVGDMSAVDVAASGQVSGASFLQGSHGIPPVGTIVMWSTNTLPDNSWYWCNGDAISRTTYADLFAVIGTTYGAGNGSTTFDVPDLRDRAVIGKGNMGGASDAGRIGIFATTTLGQTGGADQITLTSATMPSHTHSPTVTDNGHFHDGVVAETRDFQADSGGSSATTWRGDAVKPGNAIFRTSTDDANISVAIASTGSGGAHDNVQPSIVLNFIIKAKKNPS